jgi:hypothetical protein
VSGASACSREKGIIMIIFKGTTAAKGMDGFFRGEALRPQKGDAADKLCIACATNKAELMPFMQLFPSH